VDINGVQRIEIGDQKFEIPMRLKLVKPTDAKISMGSNSASTVQDNSTKSSQRDWTRDHPRRARLPVTTAVPEMTRKELCVTVKGDMV